MTKSRMMRRAGHVAYIRLDVHTECWYENVKGRYIMEDQGFDEKMILKWMLNKIGCGLDSSDS
jgi:hypothetical protein